MSKQQKPSTNLLFSPANLNLESNNFFLPQIQKDDQNQGLNEGEEGSFVGQSSSSLFQPVGSNDPFANIGQTPSTSTSENEPQLFVPSSPSPPPAVISQQNTPISSSIPMVTQQNTPLYTPPTMQQNPYRSKPFYSPSSAYVPAPGMGPSTTSSPLVAPPPVTPQNLPPSNVSQQTMPPQNVPPSLDNLATNVRPPPMQSYNSNVIPHWCYSKTRVNGTSVWYPFSHVDSANLETAMSQNSSSVVQTDGGRYDVIVTERVRRSVFWEEPESKIMRCTWFYKNDNSYRYEPFSEIFADKIEQEYKTAIAENRWQRQVKIDDKNIIVFHNPQVMVHLQPMYEDSQHTVISEKQMLSKVIKRGIQDIDLANEIPESESGVPDHLVLFVLGIGPSYDTKHKSIVEYIDEFRAIQLTLLKSHFKNALESKKAARVEFLPVHWYHAMLGDATNTNDTIQNLTLPSISRLRQFTNEAMLDITFYNSPVYCQTIADTVGNELNSMFQLFASRNPEFNGNVSLVGHSLGALVIFDMLCHQNDVQQSIVETPENPEPVVTQEVTESPLKKSEVPTETLEDLLQKLNLGKFESNFNEEQMDIDALLLCSEADLKDIGLPLGPRKKLFGYVKEMKADAEKKKAEEQIAIVAPVIQESVTQNHEMDRMESISSLFSSAMNVRVDYQQFDTGTGQPLIKHAKLDFNPAAFFAIGSPIGLILTLRGMAELSEDFTVGDCDQFYNIFHPFDPMAYRIEPLINPAISLKPALMPHHKGRKRLHLQLQESLGRMGVELKQGIINSVRKAMGSLQRYWNQAPSEAEMEEQVTKVAEELLKDGEQKAAEHDDNVSVVSDNFEADAMFGKINQGKRVDYVLQERPLESFNDYMFAFQSHNCYWTNEDTALLMIKEIYGKIGVDSDRQVEKNRRLQQQNALPRTVQPPPLN